MLSIVEIRPETPADPKLIVRTDCHISTVEQRMNIGAEQKTVLDPMLSSVGDRLDMCCLQDR